MTVIAAGMASKRTDTDSHEPQRGGRAIIRPGLGYWRHD
jgi:hypothetical protein